MQKYAADKQWRRYLFDHLLNLFAYLQRNEQSVFMVVLI